MPNKDPLWIEHANLGRGTFSAKAKAAGVPTSRYAEEESSAPGKLGKEARLAETFAKMRGKRYGE